MSKFAKSVAMGSMLAVSALASVEALAEVSANVGMTSNYIWRGVSQAGDDSAVSGGIDYSHESGVYVGTWTSSLGPVSQYELDLYLGYAGEVAGMSYDVGYIKYMYPVGDAELDFDEVYGSLGYSYFTAMVAYTTSVESDADDCNDIYYSLAADLPLKEDLSVGLLVGNYDYEDDAAEDYSHYQLSLTKSTAAMGDFTFAYDQNDMTDSGAGEDDARVSVSWSTGFDL